MSTEQEKKFQELQIANQKISEQAIKINTQIEQAQQTRDKLKEAAQQKFGESDLEKLKEMAHKWHSENESALSKFEEQIKQREIEVQNKNDLIRQIQQGE